jgi:hypothetical protein
MFAIEDIKKVARINIIAGGLAVTLGTALWIVLLLLLVQSNTDIFLLILNALITFVGFGGGWYFLRTLLANQILSNLRKGQNYNKTELVRLKARPTGEPTRNGIPYRSYEFTRSVVAILAVLGLTYFLLELVGISLGGFAGGWLTGSGLGKIVFTRKVEKEQAASGRMYYFSEADLGPYTEVSYFDPNEPLPPDPQPKKLADIKKSTAPVRTSARIKAAQPIVPTEENKSGKESK